MEILLCRMETETSESRLDPHKTASEHRWSLHIEGCHRQPGSRWQVLCIITVCGRRSGTWNQASKNRNRTWFFHERIVCRFQWSSCRLSSFFPKIPGKTFKGAAQAESLRKGEQPLHEAEKENSQTPCTVHLISAGASIDTVFQFQLLFEFSATATDFWTGIPLINTNQFLTGTC